MPARIHVIECTTGDAIRSAAMQPFTSRPFVNAARSVTHAIVIAPWEKRYAVQITDELPRGKRVAVYLFAITTLPRDGLRGFFEFFWDLLEPLRGATKRRLLDVVVNLLRVFDIYIRHGDVTGFCVMKIFK